MSSWDISNKVVLVTGAANGIGAGIVRNFLEEGAKHVAILDIAEEAGKALEEELNAKHGEGKAKFIKTDVTKEDELFAAYEVTGAEQGYIDVVVNNAGIMNDSPRTYKLEIELNVTALITSSLKAYGLMRKDKGGKGGTIINISSVAGIMQNHWLPIYFATKSAVLQFSCCIGSENLFEQTGVRVLTLCFGATETALLVKTGCFDEDMSQDLIDFFAKEVYQQKQESAVRGVIEAYKNGKTASTWLANEDRDPQDITGDITEAYRIMSSGMLPSSS